MKKVLVNGKIEILVKKIDNIETQYIRMVYGTDTALELNLKKWSDENDVLEPDDQFFIRYAHAIEIEIDGSDCYNI